MEAYILKVPLNFNPFYSSTNIFFPNLVLFLNLSTMHSRLYFTKMVKKIFCFSHAFLQCDLDDTPLSRSGVDFLHVLESG